MQKKDQWYGQWTDPEGTQWDWICERPPEKKAATNDEEIQASYPEGANLFMLFTY